MSFIVKKHFCVNCFFAAGGAHPIDARACPFGKPAKNVPLFGGLR
jgi:hypothetical protein